MMTAAGRLADKIEGLRLGADDDLVKPFDFAELVARLHALRRRDGAAHPPVLVHGELRLHPVRRDAHRGDRVLRLTRKEFAVLELLMRADGAVLSAEHLLEKAGDIHADPFTNAVRITVSTLRRKLGEPAVVRTVTGVGFQLVAVLVEHADRVVITVGTRGTATVRRTPTPMPSDRSSRSICAEARTRSAGHGLGLAIVRAIARGHGGEATATTNPQGGLTVTVDLPSAGST